MVLAELKQEGTVPSPEDLIPLAQLPRELREAADLIERERVALNRVRYQTIYGYVVDGMVPAERIGGRWAVRRSDLPKLAAVLGSAKLGRPVREAA